MAIGRVPGPALESTLDRQGIDLSFATTGNSLVKLDFTNFRMGINKEVPVHALDIVGNVQISTGSILYVDQLQANLITTTASNLDMQGSTIGNVATPTTSDQVATKGYVDLALIQDSKLEQGTSNVAVIDTGAIQDIQFNIGNVLIANINANATHINDLVFSNTTITSSATDANLYISAPGAGTTQFIGSDAILLPVGSTAERPDAVTGYIRFNSENNGIEYYDGTSWIDPLNATLATMTSQTFTANGASAAFSLAASATTSGVIVSINGTVQIPVTAYVVSGTTITFTETPQNGDVIEVRQIAFGVGSVGGLNNGTTTVAINNTNGPVDFTLGGNPALLLGVTEPHTAYGSFISNIAVVDVDTAGVETVCDYFDPTIYRTAKYVLQATCSDNDDSESYEALVTHGGNVAYSTVYAIVRNTGNIVGNVSASINSPANTEVQLKYTSSVGNVTVRLANKVLIKL